MALPRRLCFVGDSFVQGIGDPTLLGWVGRLCLPLAIQAPTELTLFNLGIRGQTSGQILSRWHDEVSPRLAPGQDGGLVFSFGANDAVQAIPPDQSLSNTAAVLTRAATLAPTLMVGPPPIADDGQADQRLADLCLSLATLCRNLGVPYLPVHALLRRNPDWCGEALANDGAHPGAKGYDQLAAMVSTWPAWRRWFS